MNDKLTMIIVLFFFQEFIHKNSFDKVPIQNIPSPMYPLTKVHAKGNHTLMLLIGEHSYCTLYFQNTSPLSLLSHSLY